MPILFECEHCGRATRVADDLAGRRVRCPGCREVVTVPVHDDEIEDVNVEIVPEHPVRRARRPFEEEANDKSYPTPPPRALTLSNEAQASNPGQINVQFLKYWSCFPLWPTIWMVSTLMFLLVGMFLKPLLGLSAVCGILMVFYWIRVREHFRHGCALPGIILSAEHQLVAFCTDLSTGDGHYPAVRILRQPLNKMTGGPPKNNQRVVGVAIYEPSPTQDNHWATFHPKIINCVTNNENEIQQTFRSIGESDWRELTNYLQRIPRKTVDLHELW